MTCHNKYVMFYSTVAIVLRLNFPPLLSSYGETFFTHRLHILMFIFVEGDDEQTIPVSLTQTA